MRRPFEYLFTWLGLAYLGFLLIVAGTSLWCCSLLMPVSARRGFAQRSISRLFRLYLGTLRALGWLKLDLTELEELKSAGPMLVAPNHPCLLDAVMLLAYMPRSVCMMKQTLMRNPLYGFGARAAGYVANESAVSMVRKVREARGLGEQILVFPEGTRTVTPPANPLSGVFALLAKCADLPIQVVYIETDSDFLGKHWPLWKAPHLPVHYRAVLGPKLSAEANSECLVQRVQQMYAQHFDDSTTAANDAAIAAAVTPLSNQST
jgi:1-acyl-sn-glycerol-3-phosphate acyltransferase